MITHEPLAQQIDSLPANCRKDLQHQGGENPSWYTSLKGTSHTELVALLKDAEARMNGQRGSPTQGPVFLSYQSKALAIRTLLEEADQSAAVTSA